MKCLIVEDDASLCFTVAEAVRLLGHQTQRAATLAQAQSLLTRHKFGLIILDYALPDGTAEDLANYAAMTQPNCRIILLTGRQVFLSGENKKLAPGIDWVLRKPVSLKDLTALIEYAAHDTHSNPTAAHALP